MASMTAKTKAAEKASAAAWLKDLLARVSTREVWDRESKIDLNRPVVWGITRYISRDGMNHSIDLLVVLDGEIVKISGDVAKALGLRYDATNGGVKVSGAGMDMVFGLVNDLSRTLYDDGYYLQYSVIAP